MPRTLSSTNTANIALANTTPTYIVEFDFVPIIRISSRGDQTYNLNTYNGVSGFKASLAQDGLSGQLQWFNADYVYSDSMRKTDGVGVWVRVAYKETPVDADYDEFFNGEIGRCTFDTVCRVALVPPQQQYSPRYRITQDNFKHLTPPGTQFETSNGVVIIQSKF